MHPALDHAVSLVRDREVAQNTHASMLQARYISASRLVQCTAEDLIREVLEDDQSKSPLEPDWAEYGNARADQNLRHIHIQEPRLSLPVKDEWTLEGHADALAFTNDDGTQWVPEPSSDGSGEWVATVYENKAPLHEPDERKVDLYYRQGLLYLAMLHAKQAQKLADDEALENEGNLILESAPWQERRTFHLPAQFTAAQVVVCVQPTTAPKFERPFPVDAALCAKTIDSYLAKAKVIIAGVEAKDPDVGRTEWDEKRGKGLTEFLPKDWDMDRLAEADEGLLAALLMEREHAKEEKDAAEAVYEDIQQRLKAYLFATAATKVTVRGARVNLVRMPAGIQHFVKRASWQVRVTGKVEQPPAEVVA